LGCPTGDVLLALTTVLIGIITFLLFGATLWTVRELRAQKKATIRPAVIVRHDRSKANLANVGNGLALNVSAWIVFESELLSHQIAESIGVGETHQPNHWKWPSHPSVLGRGHRFYLSYRDAEGDYWYSYRDADRLWHTGRGDIPGRFRHKLVGNGRATEEVLTGSWEQAATEVKPRRKGVT
jgi:hypothetical protein